jgi:hypothetical protein
MRTILYYQTHFVKNGRKLEELVSPLALVDNDAGVTDLNLGAIHLNNLDDPNQKVPLVINETAPDEPLFEPMWDELEQVKVQRSAQGGIRVHAFLGGAAEGTFTLLEKDFDRYYPPLRDFVRNYNLDGVDLDIESEGKKMTDPTGTVRKVIEELRDDFGDEFTISMAPGASELCEDSGGLSGVRYKDLYKTHGHKITRFHAQFYCGWGDMSTRDAYLNVVRKSGIPAEKIVAGVVTHNDHCSDYIELATLKGVLSDIKKECPGFAGVFGWEYHRSGGSEADKKYQDKPWLWAREVSTALRDG